MWREKEVLIDIESANSYPDNCVSRPCGHRSQRVPDPQRLFWPD